MYTHMRERQFKLFNDLFLFSMKTKEYKIFADWLLRYGSRAQIEAVLVWLGLKDIFLIPFQRY